MSSSATLGSKRTSTPSSSSNIQKESAKRRKKNEKKEEATTTPSITPSTSSSSSSSSSSASNTQKASVNKKKKDEKKEEAPTSSSSSSSPSPTTTATTATTSTTSSSSSSSSPRGKVYVAAKPGRGSSVSFPSLPGVLRLDVTSGSNKKLGNLAVSSFSPLFLGPLKPDQDGDVAMRFENYWQFTKVYPQLGHLNEKTQEPNEKWRDWKKKGFALMKKGKNGGKSKGIRTPKEVSVLKKRVREGTLSSWAPSFAFYNSQKLDYISARKAIYCPLYLSLITSQCSSLLTEIRRLVNEEGQSIMILDLDGPPLALHPNGMEVTIDNLKLMLNDPRYPFGHGYLVALAVAGLTLDDILS